MSLTVFLSLGKVSANETRVLQTLDDASPRMLSIQVRTPSEGLTRQELRVIASLPDVEWCFGLGKVRDLRNSAFSSSHMIVRESLTGFPPEVQIDKGRAPRPGEVIISVSALDVLGFVEPSGAVNDEGKDVPVVGSYRADGALADLGRLVLGVSDDPDVKANLVYVLVDSVNAVDPVSRSIKAIVDSENAQNTVVSSSQELATMQAVISGQLGKFSREITLGATGIGALLIGLTAAMSSLSRRRDGGRRRALGATRSAIVALAIGEAAVSIVLGTVVGSVAGVIGVVAMTGSGPGLAVSVSIACLVTVAGVLFATPPALWVASRDPVAVLRIP